MVRCSPGLLNPLLLSNKCINSALFCVDLLLASVHVSLQYLHPAPDPHDAGLPHQFPLPAIFSSPEGCHAPDENDIHCLYS